MQLLSRTRSCTDFIVYRNPNSVDPSPVMGDRPFLPYVDGGGSLGRIQGKNIPSVHHADGDTG